ncbi:MAG: Ldh family oxidoreductase [Formivibrio sp.]|nr:Ldh family oxidoreductase [Formivibrio sp.]
MTTPLRIPFDDFVSLLRTRLENEGVPAEIAAIEAELAVEADLLGVPSHGVGRVPHLLKGLQEGRVKAVPQWRIVRDHAAVCVIDGDRGPGRFICLKAVEQAIARAKTFGIGACLATHTSHWGRAHAYAARAAQAGMIGICLTNAITSMAGWGAGKPVIGNNPLAIGLPGVDADQPIVLDMAMSQAAVGKVATWLREGRAIPSNWGFDAQGKPSSDAAAILKGAVSPMGEHKGSGLALMMQLMTAALAGGMLDHELREYDASGLDAESSKLFVVLDVAAFIDPATFAERTSTLLSWLKEHASSETEHFQWPGERGWREAAKNRREGVPVHADIVAQLKAAGVAIG